MSVSQLAQDPKPPQAKATGKGLGSSPNPDLWDEDFLQCFLLFTSITLIITLPLNVNRGLYQGRSARPLMQFLLFFLMYFSHLFY